MAQWGRNDQAVTLSGAPDAPETSNGAPMGVYTLVKGDQVNRVNGANAHFGDGSAGSRSLVDHDLYGNTTAGAFISGKAVGVFGVDTTEIVYARENNEPRPAHAGWVLRTEGTGGRAGRVQYETLVAMGSLGKTEEKYGTPAETIDGDGSFLPPDNTPV